MKKEDINILLLEPDTQIRQAMSDILEEQGYIVTPLDLPQEVFSLISSSFYEILITEFNLPQIDIFQFLERVRRESPQTAIIVIATRAILNSVIRLFPYQISDFLLKPLNVEEFLQSLKRASQWVEEKKKVSEYEEKIDELERQRQELLQSLEKLNSLTTSGKLARNLAHELKNVLTALNLSIYYIEKNTPKDEKILRHLQLIKNGIQHGNCLLMELLGLGKSDKVIRADLNKVIKESLDYFENDLKLKNIKLITKFSLHLPPVEIYPNRLKQVFFNLILNALEAMPQGGELRVSSRILKKDEKRFLELEFSDTGKGIPVDKRDKIFSPSYSDKERTGFGLGLFITKNIIEEHGGQISVDSQEGKGTKFKIRLPVVLEEEAKLITS